MDRKNNVEAELKLIAFHPEVLDNIFENDFIKERIDLQSLRTAELESHYYDTPKRKFAKNGVVFRVRKEPAGFVGTIKMENKNSGGLSERMEYNVNLPDEQPVFTDFTKINFLINIPAIVAKEGGVEELFSVIVQRRQANLRISEKTVVEMAVDIGEIKAKGKTLPIAEMEFEIIEGEISDLIDFAALLAAKISLYTEEKSKYYRGCVLAGEKLANGLSRGVKTIDNKKPFKDALAEALMSQTGHVLSCLNFAAAKTDDKLALKQLGRELFHLKKILVFGGSLFAKTGYTKHLKKIEIMIDNISLFFLLEEFVKRWQSIKKRASEIHITDEFSKTLWEKKEQNAQEIAGAFTRGSYTADMFALWGWLLSSPWENDSEVTARGHLAHQASFLKDSLDNSLQKSMADSAKFYDFLLSLELGLKLLKKAQTKDCGKLEKSILKTQKQLDGKVRLDKIGQILFTLFKTSASRLIYRDAGMLYAFYLKLLSSDEKKLKAKLSKTAKTVRKLKIIELQTLAEKEMDE